MDIASFRSFIRRNAGGFPPESPLTSLGKFREFAVYRARSPWLSSAFAKVRTSFGFGHDQAIMAFDRDQKLATKVAKNDIAHHPENPSVSFCGLKDGNDEAIE